MIEQYLPAVILAALALFIFRLLFGKKKPRGRSMPVYQAASHRSSSSTSPRRTNSKYRAVSCSGPCSAVREIREKRFLEREAPALPLPACSEPRCQCVYVHHDDRRSGRKDRRGVGRAHKDAFDYSGQADRRSRPGRRVTDLAMA